MIYLISKTNWELYSGIILLFLLVLISVFGSHFAPYPEDYSETLRIVEHNGEKEYLYAPEKPSMRHFLGTNGNGYDILTILLYGAKFTLLACFLVSGLRILMGLMIGMYLGLKNKPVKQLEATGGIPAFVVLVFIFYNFNINSPIPTWQIFIIQVFCIAVIGLPGVIVPIQMNTRKITSLAFIEAARSIGAGKFRIVTRHIFPHIREHFLSLFVTEMIGALNLIGQLGIFFYFLGGAVMTYDPVVVSSATNEWAGLIGLIRNRVYSEPWMLGIFLSAYMVVLTTFFLISQGIDRYYEKKYARYPYV